MDSRSTTWGLSIKGHMPLIIYHFADLQTTRISIYSSLLLIRGNRWIILTSLGRFLNYANKKFHDLRDPPSESHDIYSRRERLRKTLATRGFTMKFLEKVIKKSVLHALRNPGPKCSHKSVPISPSERSNPKINFSICLMRFNNENPFCVKCEIKRNDTEFTDEMARRIRYFFRDNGFSRALLRDPRNHRHKFSRRGFRARNEIY